MQFSNRENICHTTVEGKKVWQSRNVCVAVCVLRPNPEKDSELQVLGVKRGNKMSNPGKWCFPCGYLDWDESIFEAAQREVFEETGIPVHDWESFDFCELNSDPESDELQNVTAHFLYYAVGIDFGTPKDSEEVEELRWMNLKEAKEESWAFNHLERIQKHIEFLE